MAEHILVNAIWDADSKVWIAESEDVPGLAIGADTFGQLIERLEVAIPEMLAENNVPIETERLQFKIDLSGDRTGPATKA
jgi:hypothetical protein